MGKPTSLPPLSLAELVMRADAATLKAAYEARLKVDTLLAEREEAYRKIAAIEQQIDTLMGEPGAFIFPEPPMPVSGFAAKKSPAPAKPASHGSHEPKQTQPTEGNSNVQNESEPEN